MKNLKASEIVDNLKVIGRPKVLSHPSVILNSPFNFYVFVTNKSIWGGGGNVYNHLKYGRWNDHAGVM